MKKILPVKSINVTSRLLEAEKSKNYAKTANLEYRLRHLVYTLILLIILAYVLINSI